MEPEGREQRDSLVLMFLLSFSPRIVWYSSGGSRGLGSAEERLITRGQEHPSLLHGRTVHPCGQEV